MNITPIWKKSALAVSNRVLIHLRDFRFVDIHGMALDEQTRLRLAKHLADEAERFLATVPVRAPRRSGSSDSSSPPDRVPRF